MFDLPETDLAEVRTILARHLPVGCGVLAFGSRVNGRAKPYSDLDLALVYSGPLGMDRLGRVREAFVESSLSVRVDVVDWNSLPENFKKLIAARHEILIDPAITTAHAT
jgi:predicted nucleotidyltransferase